MINRVVSGKEIKGLAKLLSESNKIVITCHVSPDGDAVGSSLGLYHLLVDLGKDVKIVTPDAPPQSLKFLNSWNEIVSYARYTDFGNKLLDSADLIFCLDYNALYRVDRMSEALRKSAARKVMIDHHLQPEYFCDVTISYPNMSSTCELLFRVLCELGLYEEISSVSAECIYAGMMTDTGNFSYNSNDPNIYIIISELLKKGINKDKIYQLAMNTKSADAIRLNGYAVSEKMQIFPESKAALITLTREELEKYNYQKGDTEGLVNMPLSDPDVVWSCYMREEEGYIKISARSKGHFAVNQICELYFGGGGHRNAAGGEFRGTLDEAIVTFKKILAQKE